MTWSPPGAGELRDRVRFERRVRADNVGGVVRENWASLDLDRQGSLLPVRGGESVQADRLTGVSAWTLIVRLGGLEGLTRDDRVVELDAEGGAVRTFAVRAILDLEGRRRWWVITLEEGADDAV